MKCVALAFPLRVLLSVESLSWAGASRMTLWTLEGRPIADQLLGSSSQHPDPYPWPPRGEIMGETVSN